ncbi:MAG: gliding motility-associated C-terminal domain-containing protein [Bacteroidales bacterium]|jgi:gliding motility-associated-like protein|nr:gliding motility-associated C-terminal domain-containing protein [Bacteroidales bacterium]
MHVLNKTVCFLLLLFASLCSFATHNRAGEITFVHISGNTYEITITTITYSPSPADRNELLVNWGDGSTDTVQRVNGPSGYNVAGYYCAHLGETLEGYNDVQLNKYTTTHTYAGAGSYIISVEDPNRNYGVANIPNSVEVPFYIETFLMINPFLGSNDSPQLLLLPVDKACVGTTFITNPGAYDPDGDSLSYELITCMGADGKEIPGYIVPDASDYFIIDERTGDIIWEKPMMQGEYNVAMKIKEWRRGIQIGYIVRDFQILVLACDNQPPVLDVVRDTCVVAAELLEFEVKATDYDYNYINIEIAGEPFMIENSNAEFEIIDSTAGSTIGLFSWTPGCYEVRKNPYMLYYKATDEGNIVNLSTIGSTNIYVLGPPPENLSAEADRGDVYLHWDKYMCRNAKGLYIYRSKLPDNHVQETCSTGMPADWGYERIATIDNIESNTYIDRGDEGGLAVGVTYSYRISAYFINEVEGKLSEKAEVLLKKDVPVITHVTVEKTDRNNGEIKIILSPPTEIDLLEYPGPYKYFLYRYDDNSENYLEIASADNLNDSIFQDSGLNTLEKSYKYYFGLYQNNGSNLLYMGRSAEAGSIFLTSQSGDGRIILNWTCSVPWINSSFTVFRQDDYGNFDSIASTENMFYEDINLENEKEYCYYIQSVGYYSSEGYIFPILNNSQIDCEIPMDNEPPCVPQLYVKALCDDMINRLSWENPETICGNNDVAIYYIYYQPEKDKDFILLDSISYNASDTSYLHYNFGKLSGCYYVRVADYSGNVSDASEIVCILGNECPNYELPNVFTPNGDGFNDKFVPIRYSNIESVNATIYNRQGKIVFESNEIEINWDGKDKHTKLDVSVGVYFYVCVVRSYSYEGIVETILSGYIHLFR